MPAGSVNVRGGGGGFGFSAAGAVVLAALLEGPEPGAAVEEAGGAVAVLPARAGVEDDDGRADAVSTVGLGEAVC